MPDHTRVADPQPIAAGSPAPLEIGMTEADFSWARPGGYPEPPGGSAWVRVRRWVLVVLAVGIPIAVVVGFVAAGSLFSSAAGGCGGG